jgi:hypothetical protein
VFSVLEGLVWKQAFRAKWQWSKRHLRLRGDALRYSRSFLGRRLNDAVFLLESMCARGDGGGVGAAGAAALLVLLVLLVHLAAGG